MRNFVTLTAILALLSPDFLPAQPAPVSDCLGAIPICRPVYVEERSPSGPGNQREINPAFNCVREERNSIWYTFTAGRSGRFGFLLTPADPADDFDWALFDLTAADCAELFRDPSLIVSCNAAGGPGCTGATGATGQTGYSDQGFNCGNLPPSNDEGFSPFNDLIPVRAGNTYVLCVTNWTGSVNGFTIDFGIGDDIGIFDQIPPAVAGVMPPADCRDGVFALTFTEPVLCATVDSGNFLLRVDGRRRALRLDAGNCAAGGRSSRSFRLELDRPVPRGAAVELELRPSAAFPVTDPCGNGVEPFRYSVRTSLAGAVELGPDTLLCPGQELRLDLAAPGVDSARWQDGVAGLQYVIRTPGLYAVAAFTECGVERDTIGVAFLDGPPIASLGPDTTICPGDRLVLDAGGSGGASFRWQDGATGPRYLVREAGEYAVTVSNTCGTSRGAVRVAVTPPIVLSLPTDTVLCPGASLVLDAGHPGGITYQWKDRPPGPAIRVTETGTYTVAVAGRCERVFAEVAVRECTRCTVYLPNAFSPNGDGRNEVFTPQSNCPLQAVRLRIFDRWGGLVFEEDDPRTGWDGRQRGRPAGEGTYVWTLDYTVVEDGRRRTARAWGDVVLLR